MKKALVLGKGKSGISAKEFLENEGFIVEIYNTQEIKNSEELLRDVSLICISPGISINNEFVKYAMSKSIPVVGEIELGCKKCLSPIIAITGTNGKTTTTSIIGDLCKTKYRTYVGGNIGLPVTSFISKVTNDDIVVLEISSFQAESFTWFRPKISVFLNFDDDHLDRHKTKELYFQAKLNLIKNQKNTDYMVVNADDDALCGIEKFTNAKIYKFSLKQKVYGCYMRDNCIYFNEEKVCTMPSNITSRHNRANVLAAVCVAKLVGVSNRSIYNTISNFKIEQNRIEIVDNVNGVTFINDSKSTNILSTKAAIDSIEGGLILILGGSDKGYDFDGLFKYFTEKIRKVYVIGETKEKMLIAAKRTGYINIEKVGCLDIAVRKAFIFAKEGESVLLSPACASFDMFLDYKHRGREFKRIVGEIRNENSRYENKQEGKV